MKKAAFLGFCALFLLGACTSSKPHDKDSLILFLGSDWNEQSLAFINNVLTPQTQAELRQRYRLSICNITRRESLPQLNTCDNPSERFAYYNITEVPWIVLENATKDVYIRQALSENIKTAQDFFSFLDSTIKDRENCLQKRAKIRSSQGVEKIRAIDTFLKAMPFVHQQTRKALAEEAIKADPQDKSTLLSEFVFMRAYMQAMEYAQKKNLLAAGDEFISAVDSQKLGAKEIQEALYLAAYHYALSGKIKTEQLLNYLQRARAADSSRSEYLQEIDSAIKHLQNKK